MTKSKKHSSDGKRSARKQAVAIIMGSKTDLPQMNEATQVLKDFGIKVHVEIVSAHRTPVGMVEFAQSAHEKYDVIIAGAGGAAHLPGMVAALTPLPVIGVPVTVNSLKGLDALLSIVQMPKGVPVATVAVDNAHNAGLLALRILATSNPVLMKKLFKHAEEQRYKVKVMNKALKAEMKKQRKKNLALQRW